MIREYLTIKDASKYLGVTSQTLRNWDKWGKLKTFRNSFNNYRVYKFSELQKIFKQLYGEIK